MIGNDVVDITEAAKESKWNRKGFLKKIFTNREQFYISNSDNSDLMVWLLWSMKESAYKIYLQQYLKRFFSPSKFECMLIATAGEFFYGEVLIEDITYKSISKISADKISTIAYLKDELNLMVIHNDFPISGSDYKTQHREVYSKVLSDFSEKINKPAEQLTIMKDANGIPRLYYKDYLISTSLSISHHGRFGSYAIAY